MKKFSEYAQDERENFEKNSENFNSQQGAFEFLKGIASKYEGASESELMSAILKEAKRSREDGSLSDGEIENFVNIISPMLNGFQKSQLKRLVEQIKKE